MNLQVSSLEDLFIRYLIRLTEEYPFIRLNKDDSSTTINLGYEFANEKEEISYQKFLPFEKYPIQIDFQKLQNHPFHSAIGHPTICTITKPTEMLLETKTKLQVESTSPERLALYHTQLALHSNDELNNFLSTHQRVVLEIAPNNLRQPHNKESELVAIVLLSTTQQYHSSKDHPFIVCGMTKIGKYFEISSEQIWWSLPREKKFDVFILRKDTLYNTTICEIVNKKFQKN